MPRNVAEYRCLLISPGDVDEEREALEKVVNKWNAQVGEGLNARVNLVRWENHAKPEMGDSPQDILNSQIVEDCDLGIAVFWSRLGTPTEEHPSGSVEEIYQLMEDGARVMVYFSDAPVPQDKIENSQFERLHEVKEEFMEEGLLFSYDEISELKEMVHLHLTSAISEMLTTDRTGNPLSQSQQVDAAPKPDVDVSAGVAVKVERGPFANNDFKQYITVTARNRSTRAVFLSTVAVLNKSEDGKSAAILEDAATRAPFSRKRLESGESFSISIDPENIEEVAPLEDFETIVIADEAGYEYRVDEKEFEEMVESYRNDK